MVGSRERQLVAVAALATLPGVPTVFAGDELGAEGLTGEHARTPMPWTAIAAADETVVDTVVLEATGALLTLRRELPALRRGGLRWLHASADALTFVRTHPDGDVLVHLARPQGPGPATEATVQRTVGAVTAAPRPGAIRLEATGPGAVVLSLP